MFTVVEFQIYSLLSSQIFELSEGKFKVVNTFHFAGDSRSNSFEFEEGSCEV